MSKRNPVFEKTKQCGEVKGLNKKDRTIEAIVSKKVVDRDSEVLIPTGCKKRLKNFMKNPVLLWAHNPTEPPIGKWVDIKVTEDQVEGVVQFLPEGKSKRADEVWAAYEFGALKAFSVGFRAWEVSDEPVLEGQKGVTITDWEIYEISAVPVPSNPEALVKTVKLLEKENPSCLKVEKEILVSVPSRQQILQQAIDIIQDIQVASKTGESISDMERYLYDKIATLLLPRQPQEEFDWLDTVESLRKEVKKLAEVTKTPSGDTGLPLAPEGTSWDAGRARKNVAKWASSDGSGDSSKINWTKYSKAFFWKDPENSNIQGGYKLPFADVVDGTLKAVWKGVAASMAALLGARGGVDIPSSERKAVYNKIASYYKRFDKEPPEFKDL